MKSIICSFLLLTTFCLVPFVAFSSTFTSTNPIVLPTTTHDFVLPEVLDSDGQPLKIGEEYTIHGTGYGVGGVYLADTGGPKCPNAVAMHIVTPGDLGYPTPVKFIPYKPQPAGVVHEMEDINIMFSGPTFSPCVNETVWKAGYYIIPPSMPRFVITGGTLGNIDNRFKIEKFEMGKPGSYKLRYCPSKSMCSDVDVIDTQSGLHRLALTNQSYAFRFDKFKKKDA